LLRLEDMRLFLKSIMHQRLLLNTQPMSGILLLTPISMCCWMEDVHKTTFSSIHPFVILFKMRNYNFYCAKISFLVNEYFPPFFPLHLEANKCFRYYYFNNVNNLSDPITHYNL
jgi:hypothetical protein